MKELIFITTSGFHPFQNSEEPVRQPRRIPQTSGPAILRAPSSGEGYSGEHSDGPPQRVRGFLRAMNSWRGFSMLELVLVTGLMVTVAAIALPRLIQMRRSFGLQSDLRKVQVAIHTARYNAISQGVQWQLVLQKLPSPQMQLQVDAAGNPLTPNFVNFQGAVPLAPSVQLSKGGRIICDPNGMVTATGFDVSATEAEPFVALSSGSRSFYVYISRAGRVRVIKTTS